MPSCFGYSVSYSRILTQSLIFKYKWLSFTLVSLLYSWHDCLLLYRLSHYQSKSLIRQTAMSTVYSSSLSPTHWKTFIILGISNYSKQKCKAFWFLTHYVSFHGIVAQFLLPPRTGHYGVGTWRGSRRRCAGYFLEVHKE